MATELVSATAAATMAPESSLQTKRRGDGVAKGSRKFFLRMMASRNVDQLPYAHSICICLHVYMSRRITCIGKYICTCTRIRQ